MANAAIQDGAALGVARALGVEDNVCLMHDNDKVGSSAVGNLVRTKNKREINPFPEGQALLKNVLSCSAHPMARALIVIENIAVFFVGTHCGKALLIRPENQ